MAASLKGRECDSIRPVPFLSSPAAVMVEEFAGLPGKSHKGS